MRLALCLVLACVVGTAGASTQPRTTLKPFASEREWGELLARWREAAHTSVERRRQESLGGPAMNMVWNAERSAGELALMRVPLSSFGDAGDSAPRSACRPLPSLQGAALQNRFVGDWLLYGTPAGGAGDHAVALRFAARGGDAQTLTLAHGVERIEALGRDAVLIGNAGRDLHLTSLRLADNKARVANSHVQHDATQGETRTHGFFYRATAQDEGLIGLPVIGAARAPRGQRGESASVLFLRQRALRLAPVGELKSSANGSARDDQCQARQRAADLPRRSRLRAARL